MSRDMGYAQARFGQAPSAATNAAAATQLLAGGSGPASGGPLARQPSQPLRLFSYGGGVQSTAALVLAARGKLDFGVFLFANVGDDSEHPATIEYVNSVAMPFAAEHGIELSEVTRGDVNPTLMTKMRRLESSLPIPVRMDQTGKPGRRSCTQDYKIMPLAREAKRRGGTPENPAQVGLGISFDELERMRSAVDPRILSENLVARVARLGRVVDGP